jgi:hypothetical protein
VGLLLYRASRGVESAAITTLEGWTFLVRAEPTKGGGNADILTDEDRKRLERLIWVMTKLKSPRHQVTLSQIPSSQKEMWGVKNNPHFQARPRADSFQISVACELVDDWH